MKKLVLCMVVMLFLIEVREVVGGGCCQDGPKEISLQAALEEVRTTLSLTDVQLSTLKDILEKHGIKTGIHICPMTEKAGAAMGGCCSKTMEKAGATGGCCAAKKEAETSGKVSP